MNRSYPINCEHQIGIEETKINDCLSGRPVHLKFTRTLGRKQNDKNCSVHKDYVSFNH